MAIQPTHATRRRPGAPTVQDAGSVAEDLLVLPSKTEQRSGRCDQPLRRIGAHLRPSRTALLAWRDHGRHAADAVASGASAATVALTYR